MLFGLMLVTGVSAQPIDSMPGADTVARIVYLPEQLYDLALLDSGEFETRYTNNPFGFYNPLTAAWQLKPQRFDQRIQVKMLPRKKQSDGYALLLLSAFILLVFIINRNRQFVRNIFQSLFNWRLAVQFAREQVANRTVISLLYVGIFNLLLALYILEWVAGRFPGWSVPQHSVWVLLVFLAVTAIYLFKYFFYKLLGVLLSMREQASFYLAETFLIHRALVFLLLPAMAALYFMPANLPQVRIFVLVVLALGAIWRYVNAIRFMLSSVSAHLLHFILYFCAVEIIPTAVIVKFLLNV